MLRGWLPQVLPHSRQRSSYVLVPILQLLSVTAGRAGKNYPVNTKPLFRMGKEAREMRINCAYPNLMVPVAGRELAPDDQQIRLPWRPRARPSATLHEIPVCSNKEQTWNWIIQPTNRSVKRVYSVGAVLNSMLLIAQQFCQRPNVVGNARFHRRSHAKLGMYPGHVVVCEVQLNCSFQ